MIKVKNIITILPFSKPNNNSKGVTMDIIKIPITPTIIPNNHNESDSFLFINPKYINTFI